MLKCFASTCNKNWKAITYQVLCFSLRVRSIYSRSKQKALEITTSMCSWASAAEHCLHDTKFPRFTCLRRCQKGNRSPRHIESLFTLLKMSEGRAKRFLYYFTLLWSSAGAERTCCVRQPIGKVNFRNYNKSSRVLCVAQKKNAEIQAEPSSKEEWAKGKTEDKEKRLR